MFNNLYHKTCVRHLCLFLPIFPGFSINRFQLNFISSLPPCDMSNQRNTKRKRATGPMIVGEVDSAQVVTPKTIYKTKKDGTVMSTQIWESLDPPSSSHVTPAIEKMKERETLNHEPAEFPLPPPEGSHTFPVGIQSLNPFSLLNIRRPDTT